MNVLLSLSSDVDGPLSPLCQLLGVLPLDSRHLLPPAFLPLTQPATDTTPAGDLAPYFPAYEEVPVGAVLLCVVFGRFTFWARSRVFLRKMCLLSNG